MIRNSWIIAAFIFVFSGCFNEDKKQEAKNTAKVDSVKKDSVIVVKKKSAPKYKREYDDIARYIAGLPQDTGSTLDPLVINNPEWKKYSADLNKNWKKYDSTRTQVMKQWVAEELTGINADTGIVFYPFSGPDILNAVTLFPKSKQFVMVGLEPVGTLPDLKNKKGNDSVSDYLVSIKNSLQTIINLSFFKTKAMAVDLHKKELDGTLHLILLFLERTNNKIADIRPVSINREGKLVLYNSFKEAKKDTLRNKGVEVAFIGPDSVLRKVIYFSVNLSNDYLRKNQAFMYYVNSFDTCNTYVKSASYLMHKPYFSVIREIILAQSKYILQDDSGIPFKFFTAKDNWDLTYYGTYSGAIPMFVIYYQKDLEQAYTDKSSRVKKLPFGIGYKYEKGKSNLLLARKK